MQRRPSLFNSAARALLALSLVGGLALSASPAGAQDIDSDGGPVLVGGFEQAGNQDNNGNFDWEDAAAGIIPHNTFSVHPDSDNLELLSAPEEGDSTAWTCQNPEMVAGGDVDILTTYMNWRPTDTGLFLDLAFVRGARENRPFEQSNVSFEINQNPTATGDCDITRSAGDLLVSFNMIDVCPFDSPFDFFCGSPDLISDNVQVYRWDTAGSGSWVDTAFAPSVIRGGVNDQVVGDITDFPIGGTIDQGLFGEVSIDLIAALGLREGTCVFSGVVNGRTRTENINPLTNVDASPQDHLAPIVFEVSNCASINITKDVPNVTEDPTVFTFGGYLPLGISETSPANFFDITGGLPYTFTETVPDDYLFGGVVCNPAAHAVIDNPNHSVTLTPDPFENIDCTFTNTATGTITIVKTTDPEQNTNFGFSQTIDNSGNFDLNDDGVGTENMKTFEDVIIGGGPYTVTESDPGDGADLTDIVCSDADDDADASTVSVANRTVTANLQPGEDLVCTFTNTRRGQIVLTKVTDDDSEGTFEFNPSWSATNIELEAGGPTYESALLVPGSYSIVELEADGYELDLDATECSDGSTLADLDLDPGETINCTIVNAHDSADLTVEVEGGDPHFVIDPEIPGEDPEFDLNGDGDPNDPSINFADVPPGEYTITISDIEDGWELDGAECDNVDSELDGDELTFTLEDDDEVTCTFTLVEADDDGNYGDDDGDNDGDDYGYGDSDANAAGDPYTNNTNGSNGTQTQGNTQTQTSTDPSTSGQGGGGQQAIEILGAGQGAEVAADPAVVIPVAGSELPRTGVNHMRREITLALSMLAFGLLALAAGRRRRASRS